MSSDSAPLGEARYVFAVTFRLEPATDDLSLSPAQFETSLYRRAVPPGDAGWRFFRDHLWHGELSEPDHFRALTEDALGVPVTAVSFRELQAGEAYLEALRAEIGDNLAEFRADSVDQALTKYLGSSVRVLPSGRDEGT